MGRRDEQRVGLASPCGAGFESRVGVTIVHGPAADVLDREFGHRLASKGARAAHARAIVVAVPVPALLLGELRRVPQHLLVALRGLIQQFQHFVLTQILHL